MKPHLKQIAQFVLVLGLALAENLAAERRLAQREVLLDRAPGQPLAENINRVGQTLTFLGAPLSGELASQISTAAARRDSERLQQLIDPRALFIVTINPEGRVKVERGMATASLQQSGYTPVLVKILNQSAVIRELRMWSPQAGQVYAGMSPLSAQRMQRVGLKETSEKTAAPERFLEIELYTRPPLPPRLEPLRTQYTLALIYSHEAGRREATVAFDLGSDSQDLGFRGEVPVLFEIRPAIPVKLHIRDQDGSPTAARLTFRDDSEHVFPPQSKRLAPDFYFQPQIYRADGAEVLLPPGRLSMQASRGPEYQTLTQTVEISEKSRDIQVRLRRWINPAEFGFYSGDHHIHGAGCAHYSSPTEGVKPQDMFLQVKGEGLNVGCILTWGPCFDFQRQFFLPGIDPLSERFTIPKYDLEISGFGSEALGHVCLLNLKDQTYPGSDGLKTKGWPSWTTPVMRWAKQQGGVTGYAHSASGLEINGKSATARLFKTFDVNGDKLLAESECATALLPIPFSSIDTDGDRALTESELLAAHDLAAERLPNLAIPEMSGVGAMEIPVSLAAGVCDFISAMDTPRIAEWNMWYHLLNCGFPLKASGETDFPCMSGERVGQGRVYVQLGKVNRVDFSDWCRGLAQGKSYVSDGFAHALDFQVNHTRPGEGEVRLNSAGTIHVQAKVAFAPEIPRTTAQGVIVPPDGKKWLGDTVTLHGPRIRETIAGGSRLVEIVVNGKPVASQNVAADGKTHELRFDLPITQSSWIALRQFPELHTNPVNVNVGDKPIRASRSSALWCIEVIEQLWRARQRNIKEPERAEARAAFDSALAKYREIAAEAKE